MSLIIIQYNTVLTKMVHNYFEAMMNYIIAVTSCVQRNNMMHFVLIHANFFMDDITMVMNSYWIDSLITATLGLKPSTSSRVCLICTFPG